MAKNYCYLRVSSTMQNLDRQYEAMKHYEIPEENYYVEKISGRTTNRPKLQELLAVLESGDTLHIHEFSRLSRSTSDLLKIIELLNEKGVTLISNKENLDTSTATGRLMLTMIAAINEFEIAINKERQIEGIHEAQKRNAYKQMKATDEEFFEVKKLVDEGKIAVSTACTRLGLKSRKSWYNRLEIYKRDGKL